MRDCLYTYTEPDGTEHRFDSIEDLHAFLLSDQVKPEDISKAKTPVSALDGEPLSIHHAGLTELATRLGLPEPERAEYRPPEWYRNRGDKLLANGANPYEVNNPNNTLYDRIAIAGSHLNELQQEADQIARNHPDGVDSDAYKDAALKMNAYANDIMKKLGSEAGASMVALQTPVDWTSFSSVKQRVEKQTKKSLTESQKEKVKKFTDAIKEVKDQLAKLDREYVEATERAMREGDVGAAPKRTYSERAKAVADTFRKLKTKPFTFKDENGKDIPIKISGLDWNALVEIGAQAIEKTGEIADGVAEIINKIKDTDWYIRLSTNDKEKLAQQLRDHYDSVRELTPEEKLLKRKEKERDDLEAGKVRQKTESNYKFTEDQKRRLDQLNDEIYSLKERMGLNKSKSEKPPTGFEKAASDKNTIQNLQEKFVDKTGNEFTTDESRSIWDYMKKSYLDNGMSIKDAIANVATDLGLTWYQVSTAITSKKTKGISDAMWNKQARYRRMQQATEDWVESQDKTAFGNFWRNLSGVFRGLAVFGHGAIFIGTHAGMTLFNPSQWKYVIPAYIRAYKFAYGKAAIHEQAMEALKNRRNYVLAQRAGLKNNPDRINVEEFQKSQKYLHLIFGKHLGEKLEHAGERGFNAIKLLRQDLFDYHYDRLSEAEKQDDESLKNIAKLINNATGATNLKIPKWLNEVSFAGGMEAARWGKLTRNPALATSTALKALFAPETASASDRVFARVWARRVGEQIGTFMGMLFVNAAIQKMINPSNPTNIFNWDDSDWLKFKFGDTTIDPTSGMIGAINFIKGIGKIPFENRQERKGKTFAEAEVVSGGKYLSAKLAPFYSTAYDALLAQKDFYGNTFPYSTDKPQKGAHRLTWGEYAWEKAPIPVAEAAHIVYQAAHEHGVSPAQLGLILDGAFHGALSGATGFRIGEYDSKKPNPVPQETQGGSDVVIPDSSPSGVIVPQ